MIQIEDIKNINEVTFKKLIFVYKNAKHKSFLQNPTFVIADENKNTCFYYEIKNEIQAFCFVKEFYFSKIKSVKSCSISFGIISINNNFEKEIFNDIIQYYKHKNYSEITIDFLLNTFPQRNKIKEILTFQSKFNRGTLLIDLKIDFKTIYNNFSTLLKKNYKKGLNSGLEIKEITNKTDFLEFLNLHIKLSKSRNIDLISDKEIYKSLNFIITNNSGFILGCYKENKMIGGVACISQGNRIEYYLGVSDPEYRKLPLSHLTLIRAIEKAQENSFEWFDMGGVILDAPKENQIHNITNFKLNFSSNFTQYYPKFSIKLNLFNYLIKHLYLEFHKIYFKTKFKLFRKFKI